MLDFKMSQVKTRLRHCEDCTMRTAQLVSSNCNVIILVAKCTQATSNRCLKDTTELTVTKTTSLTTGEFYLTSKNGLIDVQASSYVHEPRHGFSFVRNFSFLGREWTQLTLHLAVILSSSVWQKVHT